MSLKPFLLLFFMALVVPLTAYILTLAPSNKINIVQKQNKTKNAYRNYSSWPSLDKFESAWKQKPGQLFHKLQADTNKLTRN